MRILLVDDESGVRETMAATVGQFDESYEVLQAEDGEDALRLLDDTFELVITDIKMPGMDGIELTRRIRERYPDLVIFMLTGYAEFEYARAAIHSHVSEYLLKPVSVQSLRESIGRVAVAMNGRREQERISRLREMTLIEKRVQDLLYELPLPYYDAYMFPDFDEIGIFTVVIEDVAAGGRMGRFAVKNVLGDVLQPYGIALVFVEESHLTCIVFMEGEHSPLSELIAACKEAVRVTLRKELRISEGGTAKQLSEVGALYWQSLSELGFDRQPAETRDAEEQEEDGMHHLIRQTLQILESEYDQELTLSGLAERLYLNPNYLSTLFKGETGTTFTQALLRIRMEKAKELLRKTKLKIYEIGSQVGYADSAHFSRVFKNHEAMSPYDYRDKHAHT